MFNRYYLRDVTGLTAHWQGCKRRVASLQSTVQYGGKRQYYWGAMQRRGSELFYGVMRPLYFQEARCFLADGCRVDLFGGCQVFLIDVMGLLL